MSSLIITLWIIGFLLFFGLLFFFIFGFKPLQRAILKSNGLPASAVILEKKFGSWVSYSGSEYSGTVSSQQVILKLEVHSPNSLPYITYDKFMAKAIDLMRLNEGCTIQVYIAKNNPRKVVCDPKTVTASANAPVNARAGMAMADLASQAYQGAIPDVNQVLEALKSKGVQVAPPVINGPYPPAFITPAAEDPKTKIEKLKEMLVAGLITQQEFDAKKKEILEKM